MNILRTAEFHGPDIADFFPEALGGFITRINMIQLLATAILVIVLFVGTRRLTVVPGRFQSIIEMGFGFVTNTIAADLLGKKDGRRFLPILLTTFFGILFMNMTGAIPFLNIQGTSVMGAPAVFAIVAYVVFIYAGIKKHGFGRFLKASLIPGGVPIALIPIIAIVELISTFIVRPVSLALRLLLNMMVGHMMLVLFFSATNFFFFSFNGFTALAPGTFALGLAFTVFEIGVAFLQAYVFTILTAVYIQLSLADEH